jgi:hypothetical protein
MCSTPDVLDGAGHRIRLGNKQVPVAPIPRVQTPRSPFRCFRTSPNIIRLAVMMNVRFQLSLWNVEDLLHERGTQIGYKTMRFRWQRFGPAGRGLDETESYCGNTTHLESKLYGPAKVRRQSRSLQHLTTVIQLVVRQALLGKLPFALAPLNGSNGPSAQPMSASKARMVRPSTELSSKRRPLR